MQKKSVFYFYEKIGVIQNDKLKKSTDWYSDYFWIWESIFGVIAGGIEIHLLKKKVQALVIIKIILKQIDEGAENW